MFRIFALGVRKDLFRGPRIDKKALLHYAYVVTDVLYNGEIVRNKKNREPEIATKVPEEV